MLNQTANDRSVSMTEIIELLKNPTTREELLSLTGAPAGPATYCFKDDGWRHRGPTLHQQAA